MAKPSEQGGLRSALPPLAPPLRPQYVHPEDLQNTDQATQAHGTYHQPDASDLSPDPLLTELRLIRRALTTLLDLYVRDHQQAARQVAAEQQTAEPSVPQPDTPFSAPSDDLLVWAEIAREALEQHGQSTEDEAVLQWLSENAPVEVQREVAR